ncbi:MAG: glycoside hydrolase family 38 C-terminal domain-containing protein [Candidatus Aminicenantales bacterium]
MRRQKIHLVANAHLDPVWLWDWEEGATEALATFRTAARLIEEFPEFIFNHNEAVLYQWVEEHEPALFKKIQRLVEAGQWQIMGGWYLQPDCNMPSGESFVRQILLGKRYFKEKFGVDIKTASNLDPFGHSRGLVQILSKSGFDSYIFCRPSQKERPLPSDDFIWVGFDGSEIMACRVSAHYNSAGGAAARKVLDWIANHADQDISLLLWGVGNHGGGPTRQDLVALRQLIKETKDWLIFHSTPRAYFKDLRPKRASLPRHAEDLNPWAVGCYTTMARVKQGHRRLENELWLTEKMVCAAHFQGLMPYPQAELEEASRDLAFIEFHDILPGSSIPAAEDSSLRRINHGLEILSRLKAKAFIVLARGELPARDGEFPIFVYNPHPFPADCLIEAEFQPYEFNSTGGYLTPRLADRTGRPLFAQPEKESSNLNVEWRKKIVFAARLEPSQMNRFSCWLEKIPSQPSLEPKEKDGQIYFKTQELEVIVNARTGLIDRYCAHGVDFLAEQAFRPLVLLDNADPWGMTVRRFRDLEGAFELASPEEARRACGVSVPALPPVRVVEDGPVRTVIEAVFKYHHSFLFQRYKLPRKGTEIEVETRVHWLEKDRMLKLSLPTLLRNAQYLGQTSFGVAELATSGDEVVAQKWVAVVSLEQDLALTCANEGIYGSDFLEGEARLSLLRSPAYSADPVPAGPMIRQDRYVPRIDQGERIFRFWVKGGRRLARLNAIDREALVHNEKPFVLAFFPPGQGHRPQPLITLSDDAVQLVALKKAERGASLIIRLFEPTGRKRTTKLSLPWAEAEIKMALSPFEVKTLKFSPRSKKFEEVDLLERALRRPA